MFQLPVDMIEQYMSLTNRMLTLVSAFGPKRYFGPLMTAPKLPYINIYTRRHIGDNHQAGGEILDKNQRVMVVAWRGNLNSAGAPSTIHPEKLHLQRPAPHRTAPPITFNCSLRTAGVDQKKCITL